VTRRPFFRAAGRIRPVYHFIFAPVSRSWCPDFIRFAVLFSKFRGFRGRHGMLSAVVTCRRPIRGKLDRAPIAVDMANAAGLRGGL